MAAITSNIGCKDEDDVDLFLLVWEKDAAFKSSVERASRTFLLSMPTVATAYSKMA
eukprot:CAMPEP_0118681958 /NCGR_PEP_ID=MMETSP0800-20121206/5227_1 /TAXON_ID=210618 ORGANISM="Striatella unipunctata, Strain CCMP2910" /NCGR_SAMPLE_ID=MMETSP0800 /ASSEMBLY_ACC=CAM_ASM_000638 /LENGTH=55 /DNA_ID=CAMNT_0006578311 /DNA_START=163 /DNA_END=330 /DNA_ORIENTATION=-